MTQEAAFLGAHGPGNSLKGHAADRYHDTLLNDTT